VTDTVDRLSAALADCYRLERELGAGGMATVYLAEDLKHHRRVALKVLRPELSALLGAERFLKEIEVTANLQHPHLLPLFDSGEAAGLLFYVMPYVEGESLREKLAREKQLGIEEAVRLATQVASALDYAHRRNVIHRDIKPENILLHEGQALIADFGIALALRQAGGNRLTETGLSLGTPQYMSPEQASGDRQLDARSDIYSLACVLYEMLAGEPPHTGPTVQAVIAKLLADRPRPVGELRTTVPVHVAAALDVALSKLPADRFATAAEFSEALGRPGTHLRTAASTAVVSSRRRPLLPIVGAATLVAAASLGTWLAARGLRTSREVERFHLDVPGAPRWNNQWGGTVHFSRGRPGIIYFSRGGRWFRPLDSLGARLIPQTTGEQLVVAPDGRQVGVRSGAWVGRLVAVPIEGGGERLLSDSVLGYSISWGTDGYLYFTTPDLVLARVPETGGPLERLTSVDAARGETVHAHAFVLPEGEAVLFTAVYRSYMNLDSAFVSVLNLRSGERRILFPGFSPRYVRPGYLVFGSSDGSLRAVAFDATTLRPTGSPVVVAEAVRVATIQTGADYDVGDDGDLVYVTSGVEGRTHFVWVTREGRVTSVDSGWPGRSRGFALSPDGRRMAVSLLQDQAPNNIWLRDLPEGVPFRLTDGNILDATPRWSPDGRHVLYSGPRPPARLAWDLYAQPVQGGPDSLLVDGKGQTGSGALSSDGRWLVWTDAGDIFARRASGDTTRLTLVRTRFADGNPAISPDSRWLAFTSQQSGRSEVYVRPLEPSSTAQWQISDAGGTAPRWSLSGRELYFIDGERRMVAATAKLGDGAPVITRRVLFSVAGYQSVYDVQLGDRGFILQRNGFDRGWGDIVLVRGFREELELRLKDR
jgi:serine/threonine-protein kinase